MTFIVDGTAGVTYPNSTVQASAGVVLQVVQANLTTSVTTTSSTLVTTGLTASITPKFSTSKILVLINMQSCYKTASAGINGAIQLALYRGAGVVQYITDLASYTAAATSISMPINSQYLDSPATTSSTAYTVYFASANSGGVGATVNTYNLSQSNNVSTITLMEIAG
jgi:hypothetical protein